ncbi:MAG: threonine--tRNA ligase [Nanoarchaeota archaeon]|nr:threonine--tRNA ligase [Nanoarchaeota archaeon]
MGKIKIKLPDNTEKEYNVGISPGEIAESIGPGLARAAIAAKAGDNLVDLSAQFTDDTELAILTFKDEEGKEIFRHSTAHVMAAAVLKLFPEALPTIGPAIEDGFYYDFDHKPFTPEDLEKIEKEMKKIIESDVKFERIGLTKKEALDMFKSNKFKVEMIKALHDDDISAYKLGDFVDLCRGPHVPSAGKIKSFKLTKVAGAYWKGDAKREQLQRIYGTSFPDKKELKKHLHMIEEAEKRDHRKIGKLLDLFSFHEEARGFPFFHNNGMIIWNILLEYWREVHKNYNYEEIKTPMLLNKALWETSGHWENYRENMYTSQIDGEDYAIKPMNCPGGMLAYKETIHSYKEFPLRVGEIGHVHRHELSGTLGGLFRVRAFHQDDAHIFMTKEQIKDEILEVIKLADEMYSTFGLEYHLELSTRPDKSIGSDEQWETATNGLKEALESTGKEYIINEGDGAFYGPKIDFHIKDAIGRSHQCGTIQLDMALPEQFDLTYESKDGKKHRPVMIHRVIYGSLERFFGILVEHYAGKFPMWLSPEQVKLLTVADRFNNYAEKVKKNLEEKGLRVDLDMRQESVSKKVRDAQIHQVNYICVVGEKEEKDGTVTVRTRNNEVTGAEKVNDFANRLVKEVEDKK